MEIVITIPQWFAVRNLRMDRPDKRLLIWFLFYEEHVETATQTLFLIDGWRVANGSRTWEAWVKMLRGLAETEEKEEVPEWLWKLVREGNSKRGTRKPTPSEIRSAALGMQDGESDQL